MIVTVPDKLFSVPAAVVSKAMFEVSAPSAVPELSIRPLVNEKFVTVVPRTPLSAVFWMNMRSIDTFRVFVNETPTVAF